MTTILRKLPLTQVWLGLLALTGISLLLGDRFGHASWMPLFVASVIWIKGTVVAHYFLESHSAHPFIAWLLRVFIAFAPVALLVTSALSR